MISNRLLKFEKSEDSDTIKKKLKIKSELLTQQSLQNLQNLKPVATKNLKVDEKPSIDSENNSQRSASSKSHPDTPTFR
jgi:hypothetical protein